MAEWHSATLFLLAVAIPAHVAAQQQRPAQASVYVTTLYDDNLFYSATDPAHDRILRISPTVSIEQKWLRGVFSGSYGFDSEQYLYHRELTTPVARVRALSSFRYQPGQRVTLVLDNAYLDTNTPSELNIDSGLATARIRARRFSGGASLNYRVSQRATAGLTIQTTSDTLADGLATHERVGTVTLERSLTQRDRMIVLYEASQYAFRAGAPMASHALRAGLARRIGGRTFLDLRAGPRMIEARSMIDARASLSHALETGALAISYEQTLTPVIGQATPLAVKNLQARAQWGTARRFTSFVAPGVFRIAQDGPDVTVFRVAFGARFAISHSVAVDIAYGDDRQRGALSLPQRGIGDLRHRTASIGLTKTWNAPEKTPVPPKGS